MAEVAYLFERFPSFGQTFCYREVVELERQGVHVHVFSIRRPDDEPPQDWDADIVRRVHYLPAEKELVQEIDRAIRQQSVPARAEHAIRDWDRRSDFLRLYQAAYIGMRLDRLGISRLHAHFAGMAARTSYWIHECFGTAYSFTAHANDIFAPRQFAIGLDKLVDSAAAVVTVSDFAVAALKQSFARAAGKIHRVYNGIDVSQFRRATFAGATPSLISVGRLIEKKGFDDLIDACALLRNQGGQFRCEIIGEGPLETQLRQRIDRHQLASVVQLAGALPQHEIVARLAAASVFVLPSKAEADGGMDNLPTVIMEAMAAALPVVSTRIAGIPEMVETGVSGELVPPNDPAACAAAVRPLIHDREMCRRLGSRGREIAEAKFGIERNVQQLRDLLLAR